MSSPDPRLQYPAGLPARAVRQLLDALHQLVDGLRAGRQWIRYLEWGVVTHVDSDAHTATLHTATGAGTVTYGRTAPTVGDWQIGYFPNTGTPWIKTGGRGATWFYYLTDDGLLRRVAWPPPPGGWAERDAEQLTADDQPLPVPAASAGLLSLPIDVQPEVSAPLGSYATQGALGLDRLTNDVYWGVGNGVAGGTLTLARWEARTRVVTQVTVEPTGLVDVAGPFGVQSFVTSATNEATGPPTFMVVAVARDTLMTAGPGGEESGTRYAPVTRVYSIAPSAALDLDTRLRLTIAPCQLDGVIHNVEVFDDVDHTTTTTLGSQAFDAVYVSARGSGWDTAAGPRAAFGAVHTNMPPEITITVHVGVVEEVHWLPLPNYTEPPGPTEPLRVWMGPLDDLRELGVPAPPTHCAQSFAPVLVTPFGDGVQVFATFTPGKIWADDSTLAHNADPLTFVDRLYRWRETAGGWTELDASVILAASTDGQQLIARTGERNAIVWRDTGAWRYSVDGGDHWAALPRPPFVADAQWSAAGMNPVLCAILTTQF